jgi:hypothetical protein
MKIEIFAGRGKPFPGRCERHGGPTQLSLRLSQLTPCDVISAGSIRGTPGLYGRQVVFRPLEYALGRRHGIP